ncbi:MAG TPA: HD domain-containing protein [Ktedonobacteraceae bacterium]|nr:HD domain-containing protein [Ktedonobacteraceae bacterium]
MLELPFTLESALEQKIAADPAWQQGVAWGIPRAGHQEGPVMYHIADVLANIERLDIASEDRCKLRLIALIHDAFKYRVDEARPKTGKNHHAHIARQFAERYITDPGILLVIETHDEAYNIWRFGFYRDRWQHAEERADSLLQRLGPLLSLYAHFFYADSDTESKNPAPVIWFKQFLTSRGVTSSH